MQNSSAFQYLAIDTIQESTTNPRRTFDKAKLCDLAESIKQHGLIQPITVRPNNSGFEIVAGARRFRASQLAEVFSIPAVSWTSTMPRRSNGSWLRTRSARTFTSYEEAQGFQRLLDIPGYDVAALVEKSGKSASLQTHRSTAKTTPSTPPPVRALVALAGADTTPLCFATCRATSASAPLVTRPR